MKLVVILTNRDIPYNRLCFVNVLYFLITIVIVKQFIYIAKHHLSRNDQVIPKLITRVIQILNSRIYNGLRNIFIISERVMYYETSGVVRNETFRWSTLSASSNPMALHRHRLLVGLPSSLSWSPCSCSFNYLFPSKMSSPNAFTRSPEDTKVTEKIKLLRQRFAKEEPVSADVREFKRPERNEIYDELETILKEVRDLKRSEREAKGEEEEMREASELLRLDAKRNTQKINELEEENRNLRDLLVGARDFQQALTKFQRLGLVRNLFCYLIV